MPWGYPPPTNSEIIYNLFIFYEGTPKNLHFRLLVGRGYPQTIPIIQVLNLFFVCVLFPRSSNDVKRKEERCEDRRSCRVHRFASDGPGGLGG